MYSQALPDVIAFLPVWLGHHVLTNPGMMMTMSIVGWKRDHP
jgi:hypothetical protein